MIKALRLACIPRLSAPGRKNWKTVPGYNLGRYGCLSFLRCNCDTKYIDGLPSFHEDIFKFFRELITLYNYDREQDMILFWITKKFSLEGSPYSSANDLKTIFCLYFQDLLNSNGQIMFHKEFKEQIRLENELLPILSSCKYNTEAASHKIDKTQYHQKVNFTLRTAPFSNWTNWLQFT